MRNFSFVQTLSEKWRVVFWSAFLGIFLAVVISAVVTPKYKSSVSILITQRYGLNTDIYAAAKFTEYLSNLLKEVIYSNSFLDQVLASQFNVRNDFSVKPEKRAKQWKRVVKSRVVSNTGIISINIFHADRTQSDNIANAVSNILITKSDQYHGAGQQVSVRLIDGPTTNQKPALPNWILNVAVGFLIGLIGGANLIYLHPEIHLDSLFGGLHWRKHRVGE